MISIRKKALFYILISFFLLINFGTVFISWQGRKLPPEPDDSYVFLSLIQTYFKYGSIFSPSARFLNIPFKWDETGGVDRTSYFSWGFIWGNLARLFQIKPESTLKLSFYFGIILFLFSIIYFFKDKDLKFKIF